MYYILMYKNIKIAFCKDDKVIKAFREDLLPIGTQKVKQKYNIKYWLDTRCIPQTRVNYSIIKEEIESDMEFNNYKYTNYGLSLNDNFWFYKIKNPILLNKILKSKKSPIPKYEDIKLYNTKIEGKSLLQALAENKNIKEENIAYHFPDNVTSGNISKYWVYRNEDFYLVKQNHPTTPKIAEKIIASQILCDIINEVRYNANNKKQDIKTADYFYETGTVPMESCCYSKCFTNEAEGLTTYAQIEATLGKSLSMQEMLDYINPSSVALKEYFDFIVLFDYLTENKRTKDDIGFIISNDSNKVLKPAPLYGFSQTFDYMEKDYERTYNKYSWGTYRNVFGMTTKQQIEYIAKIEWFDNRELFKNLELLKEYFETEADKRQLTLSNLETICNVLNHKLYHIENKKYKLAEEAGMLEEFGFDDYEDYSDDFEDQQDDELTDEDSNY